MTGQAVGESLTRRPKSTLPFLTMPLLFPVLIFYLNFTSRVVLSPLLPILEREFGLGHGEAGSLFLFMQVGYCAGLLASGFVSCRWNYRRTILLSTATLGVLLLFMSPSI